jgi:hypothetical protein
VSDRCKCGQPITTAAMCAVGHPQPDRPSVPLRKLAELIAAELAPVLAPVVAEQLRAADPIAAQRRSEPTGLVKVKEMARIAGVSPTTIYKYKEELGVRRIGTGPKPMLLFNPDFSLARMAELREQGVTTAGAPAPEPRCLPADVELLPVRGQAA